MERGTQSRRYFLFQVGRFTAEVSGVAAMAGALAACNSRRTESPPSPTPETMGGLWVTPSPQDGATITNSNLQLAAQAYPAHRGDPQITTVQFTAYWPGAPSPDPENNPGGWPILAVVHQSDADHVYRTSIDLQHIQVGQEVFAVPPGPLTISFDEINAVGKHKDAPNGEHHLTYNPAKP